MTYRNIWVDASPKGQICVFEKDPIIIQAVAFKQIQHIEYQAILHALRTLDKGDNGTIFSDSKHVVDQINGCKIRKKSVITKALRDLCLEEMKDKNIEIVWIPRNINVAGKYI